MISFKHPPRHKDPNEVPLVTTTLPFVPGQSLRYYLKDSKLMWLRPRHTLIDPKTRVPQLLASVPEDGSVFLFIPGGFRRSV